MSEPPCGYFGDLTARKRHPPSNEEVASLQIGSINSNSHKEADSSDSLLPAGFSTYISSATQLWKITQVSSNSDHKISSRHFFLGTPWGQQIIFFCF